MFARHTNGEGSREGEKEGLALPTYLCRVSRAYYRGNVSAVFGGRIALFVIKTVLTPAARARVHAIDADAITRANRERIRY